MPEQDIRKEAFPGVVYPKGATHGGMSLRDYFAGQALAGGLADWDMVWENIASVCYHAADAMIDERNKTKKGGD